MPGLYSREGQRLYCTAEEVEAFLKEADKLGPEIRLFCYVLERTGCRISEALNLRKMHISIAPPVLTFETLKKRKRGIFRSVPVPPPFVTELNEQFRGFDDMDRLWEISRTTAYWHIKNCFQNAGVHGAQAVPKGLRHAYGVHSVVEGTALNMVQKWMGHHDVEITAIYANATGKEELKIAERMWRARGWI